MLEQKLYIIKWDDYDISYQENTCDFMSTMMVKLTICFDQTVNKLELRIQLHRKIPQFLHF